VRKRYFLWQFLFLSKELTTFPLYSRLGLAKIGVIPALVNTHLRDDSLVHTVRVAASTAIIYGLDSEAAVADVWPKLKAGIDFSAFWLAPSDAPAASSKLDYPSDLATCLDAASEEREPERFDDLIQLEDPLLYIYTSGTTGLPKAVVIKHVRQLFACLAALATLAITAEDRLYLHLPLYHASGNQIGSAGALFAGVTTVVRKKFSVSNFWKDCVKHEITVTQYIGEIARYLLSAAPAPEERRHRVRLMYGNGLRAQIWTEFVDRFGIKDIAEVYGSTEGNCTMINIMVSNVCILVSIGLFSQNVPGAVGFRSPIFPRWLHDLLLPLDIIRVNRQTGEPVRGADGMCQRAAIGEEGEFVGRIVRGDPVMDFEGYRDKTATEKKILRDVFSEGDLYFRSGDIMVMDEIGWLYFRDRAGDTFRWKGENVSTQEVEAAVTKAVGAKHGVTAYGVLVAGTEGRAGMVAVARAEDGSQPDLEDLLRGVKRKLPAYARPVFVRVVPEVQMTGGPELQ